MPIETLQPNKMQPNIIFIMGMARSGSTILEVMLGNVHDFVGAGEVTSLFKDGFVLDKPCSCGKQTSECEFWAPIRKQMESLQFDFDHLSKINRIIDWHTGFFRSVFFPNCSKVLKEYLSSNFQLFQSLIHTHGGTTIIDSSKYVPRALTLCHADPQKVHIICITRSISGLFQSFKKRNSGEQEARSPLSALCYILWMTMCIKFATIKLGGRCLKISYEQLAENPIYVISSIERWLGHDLGGIKKRISLGETLHVGHIVTGNRLRKSGGVKFSPEKVNEKGFSLFELSLIFVAKKWQQLLRI